MVDVKSIIASGIARNTGNFDYTSALPGVKSTVNWYTPGAVPPSIEGTMLTGSELANFSQWYYNTFVMNTNDGPQRAFFEDKFAVSLWSLFAAKKSFSGTTYGFGVEGSLHAQSLRPETIASFFTATPAVVRNWTQSVAAGWTAKYFNFNTNFSSTTALLNTLNNVSLLVFGFAEANTVPGLQAIQYVDSGSKPYGIEATSVIGQAQQANLYNLPGAIYIDKNKTGYIDVEFLSARSETLMPVGIQFVTTEYYVSE